MSLLLLKVTLLSFLFTHFWARRTNPYPSFVYSLTKEFKGSFLEFENLLNRWVSLNPKLKIIQHSKPLIIIEETPSLFNFGGYYHIQMRREPQALLVTFSYQTKLVSPPIPPKDLNHFLEHDLKLEDVENSNPNQQISS